MANKIILKHDKYLIYIKNPEHPIVQLRYNLKEKSMQKYVRGKINDWVNTENQYDFFRGCSIGEIECEEGKGEKFKELIKLAQKINPQCYSVSTFISRLYQVLIYENYILEGIKFQCERTWSGSSYTLTKPLDFYSKNMIKLFKECDITVTEEIEEKVSHEHQFMDKLFTTLLYLKIDSEDKVKILDSAVNGYRSLEKWQTLVTTYNYDMASLIKYVCEYLIPFENLDISTSLDLLKDYYEMANRIGREVKKYPKYLKSMHDIITSNYNAYKKEYDELLFQKLAKPELIFEGKEYCTVIPNSSKDVIKEGTDLNHCVGSYIDKILERKTYIFFLRKTVVKEQSLITLELKETTITQAKGAYNRALNKEEREFLEKYCKKLNLKLGENL